MNNIMPNQKLVCDASISSKIFLTGPFGTGKTFTGVQRLFRLIQEGIPASSILLLSPQRTLAFPFEQVMTSNLLPPGDILEIFTIGKLARRMVEIYWPLVAEESGFKQPGNPPLFLNLETAQYYMGFLVNPLIEEGYFSSVVIDRNRLFSQILDNLNKSAVVGFSISEIGLRLESSWAGEPAKKHVFSDVQDCVFRFRNYCLEHNLLDFSLIMEIFWEKLWPNGLVKNYLGNTYHHLIYDNIEEDVPRTHDLILEWMSKMESCLLIQDQGGGFRQFLGADATSALRLKEKCTNEIIFHDSLVMSDSIQKLNTAFTHIFAETPLNKANIPANSNDLPIKFPVQTRFFTQMLEWIVREICILINDEKISASEIVILSSYLPDSLRFILFEQLTKAGIPARSYRPSRSLRNEFACKTLMTFAFLAHPVYQVSPNAYEVANAFQYSIENLDLVRANLISNSLYDQKGVKLLDFNYLSNELQNRITYKIGEQYSKLKTWIDTYRSQAPIHLDQFWKKLFGEVLSQPTFGFHRNLDAARVVTSLISSFSNFRKVNNPDNGNSNGSSVELGINYIKLIESGLLAAQHVEAWNQEGEEAVLIAPAYTFLMMNHPVSVQFWVDPGSPGWMERVNQPLTHPYVLSRNWPADSSQISRWLDSDEHSANLQTLQRLVSGLLHRCKSGIYLGISDINAGGFEQHGVMLKSFQRIFQQAIKEKND